MTNGLKPVATIDRNGVVYNKDVFSVGNLYSQQQVNQLQAQIAELQKTIAGYELARSVSLAAKELDDEIAKQESSLSNVVPDDDWIEWDGGDMPVDENVRVDVKFRSGLEFKNVPAPCFYWAHFAGSHPGEMIAYRVVKP